MNDTDTRFSRTGLLLGTDIVSNLAAKRVLIVGLGGVGGYAAENISRAGIGHLTLVDGDRIDITNCNRQIIAATSTVGEFKAEAWRYRCQDINPDSDVNAVCSFLKTGEDISQLLDTGFDFVIDAIDDVPVKVELIRQLKKQKIAFISSMGAGGKLDPSQVTIADISKTRGCPLARIIRGKMKELRLQKIPCVYSPEVPLRRFNSKKIGCISYIPAIFGCFCAAAAIKHLAMPANSNERTDN